MTIAIHRTMKIVAATFGNGIYTATGKVTQLHIVRSELHLHFLDDIQTVRIGAAARTCGTALTTAAHPTKRVAEPNGIIVYGTIKCNIIIAEIAAGK